jgi:predicted methyltransferase MtxX (methanogen marker protein 4)
VERVLTSPVAAQVIDHKPLLDRLKQRRVDETVRSSLSARTICVASDLELPSISIFVEFGGPNPASGFVIVP